MNSKNKLFTTISSGKFKGRKLLLPSLKTTRSTKNILKGSFFDTIRNELYGKVFVECFGGSALMAIEAYSNYAKICIAIEKDKSAFEITKSNMKSIDEKNLIPINGDCFIELPKIIANIKDEIILYIDPPFDIRDGFEEIYDNVFNMIKNVKNNKIYLIAIEHISTLKMPDILGKFKLDKTRKFGKSSLSYYI